MAHADRGHNTWSASASDRRWACAGSLAMEEGREDKESHAAAWGTAAHEVSEKALRQGCDAIAFLGDVVKTKEHEITVDEEICECAQVFIDYVRERAGRYPDEDPTVLLEQKFSLAKIKPPFDAGGMGDVVLLWPKHNEIEIVDLKGGRGIVVEATNNKQLRTYALGAVLANEGNFHTIRSTIVQPRAPHKDGRIRSEEISIIDLLEWTVDLQDAMQAAKDAAVHPKRHSKSPIWAEKFLRAGDHCTFCKAKIVCPAIENKTTELAQTMFVPAAPEPPKPEDLEMARIVQILDHADMIVGFINSVRAYAQDQAEKGIDITDGEASYVLVPKRGTRKWAIENEAELAQELAKRSRVSKETFFAPKKIISVAQAEKALGKRLFKDVIAPEGSHGETRVPIVEQKSSGYNLVRADKTTREAVPAPPKQFFQVEQE